MPEEVISEVPPTPLYRGRIAQQASPSPATPMAAAAARVAAGAKALDAAMPDWPEYICTIIATDTLVQVQTITDCRVTELVHGPKAEEYGLQEIDDEGYDLAVAWRHEALQRRPVPQVNYTALQAAGGDLYLLANAVRAITGKLAEYGPEKEKLARQLGPEFAHKHRYDRHFGLWTALRQLAMDILTRVEEQPPALPPRPAEDPFAHSPGCKWTGD